jgi:hypothetical protein
MKPWQRMGINHDPVRRSSLLSQGNPGALHGHPIENEISDSSHCRRDANPGSTRLRLLYNNKQKIIHYDGEAYF